MDEDLDTRLVVSKPRFTAAYYIKKPAVRPSAYVYYHTCESSHVFLLECVITISWA